MVVQIKWMWQTKNLWQKWQFQPEMCMNQMDPKFPEWLMLSSLPRVGYKTYFEKGLGSLSKVGLPWLGSPQQTLHLSTKF